MTPDPRLSLVFDDGSDADATEVAPTLDDLAVRATFAVPGDYPGRPGHLGPEQVRDLAGAGHEVAVHGNRHRYLQAMGLAADVEAGADRVVVDDHHAFPGEDHGVCVGDEYEVVDEDRRWTGVVGAVVDADDGAGIAFETAVDGAFAAGEAVVRPTGAVVEDEVLGGRRALREYGLDPTTFVCPYDAADPRTWRLVAEEYAVLADAAVRSLPNPPGTPPTNLRRWYLETDHLTRLEVREYLDAVAGTGGLGILAGHADWDTVTPERIRFVVDAARERGIEVLPVRDAVDAGRP